MALNRRRNTRIRLSTHQKANLILQAHDGHQLLPVQADLLNLSKGGIALSFPWHEEKPLFRKGAICKIEFNLLQNQNLACLVVVRHIDFQLSGKIFIGMKFQKKPKALDALLKKMESDNSRCDSHLQGTLEPYCFSGCSYFRFCAKPFRIPLPSNKITLDTISLFHTL